MKKKKMFKVLFILISVLLAGLALYFNYYNSHKMKNSVFSWYEDYSSDSGFTEKSVKLCKKYNIDTVYQYVQKEHLSDSAFTAYVQALNKENIQTVLIYDEPEYSSEAYQGYLTALKNSDAGKTVTGVIVDIEPFSQGAEANTATLGQYVSNMEAYAKLTQAQGLKFMVAIPTWYDTVSETLTAQLIDAADRTVLMNYKRTDFLEPVKFEVDTAVKAGKEIEDAVELQPVDSAQGITGEMTYAEVGIKDAVSDLAQLHSTYSGIRGCFHHIRYLYTMTYGE